MRMYPASTTKIMTLLLAVESDIPLDEEITIPDVAENVPSDSSKVPVYAGERMSFEDLLYGTMLHSGNDGAKRHRLPRGRQRGRICRHDERPRRRTRLHGHALFQRPRLSRRHALFHRLRPRPHHPGGHAQRDVPSDRLHPHLHHGPPRKIAGPTTSPTPRQWSTRTVRITTRAASASRRATTAAPASASWGALDREGVSLISVVLGAGRTSSDVALKWEDTEKLFEYGLSQYQPYLLTDLFEASGRNINTVTIAKRR